MPASRVRGRWGSQKLYGGPLPDSLHAVMTDHECVVSYRGTTHTEQMIVVMRERGESDAELEDRTSARLQMIRDVLIVAFRDDPR